MSTHTAPPLQPTSESEEPQASISNLETQIPGSSKNESCDTDHTSRSKKNEEDVTSVEAEGSFIQVGWEEPESQDPANPMNWPSGRKWLNIAVLSYITFLT
jgi:hypothetical protein